MSPAETWPPAAVPRREGESAYGPHVRQTSPHLLAPCLRSQGEQASADQWEWPPERWNPTLWGPKWGEEEVLLYSLGAVVEDPSHGSGLALAR